MSTWRETLLEDRWTILAPERGNRPNAFDAQQADPVEESHCPFCAGNEAATPPEILRRPAPSWHVRVVPNKYPALTAARDELDPELLESAGLGRHEVIIESADHGRRFHDLKPDELRDVIDVWIERGLALSREPWCRSLVLFKNQGSRAGESISHLHSQILVLPLLPPRLEREIRASAGRCRLCLLLERPNHDLMIDERSFFVRVAPFASRFPFEQWVIPRRHHASFFSMNREEREELGRILQRTTAGMNEVLGDASFNWTFQSGPTGPDREYHWYLDVIPRITVMGGFELATELWINIVDPRRAAELLRSF